MPRDITSPSKSSTGGFPYKRSVSGPSSPVKPTTPTKRQSTPTSPSPPAPYTIDFGKHKGTLLSQLDPSYLKWMITNNVYESKNALKTALIEHGFMNEDGSPGRAKPVAGPYRPTEEEAAALEGWVLPAQNETRQFYDELGEEKWISSWDALQYYKVSQALTANVFQPLAWMLIIRFRLIRTSSR